MDSGEQVGRVQKQSELVFLQTAVKAENEARKTNRYYHVVSKSLLSFGVVFALALPLSMLPAPTTTDPTTQPENQNVTNNYYNAAPGDGGPLKLEAVIKNTLEYVPHTHPPVDTPISSARINVAGPNVVISAVPPLNKEWHRSVFEQPGDALWALPDVDLVIRLNSLEVCDSTTCIASFDLESEQYLHEDIELNNTVGSAFTIGDTSITGEGCAGVNKNRCVSFSPALRNRNVECSVVSKQSYPVTKCRLKPKTGTLHMCLWLRRSTVPEITNLDQVALDVKWNTMQEGGKECVDPLNETRYRER